MEKVASLNKVALYTAPFPIIFKAYPDHSIPIAKLFDGYFNLANPMSRYIFYISKVVSLVYNGPSIFTNSCTVL